MGCDYGIKTILFLFFLFFFIWGGCHIDTTLGVLNHDKLTYLHITCYVRILEKIQMFVTNVITFVLKAVPSPMSVNASIVA